MSQINDRHLVGAGVAACAVCCAPPLVAFLGIAGVAATVAAFAFASVVFGLVVGVVALLAVWHRRRQARRRTCSTAVDPIDVEVIERRRQQPDNGSPSTSARLPERIRE